RHKSQGWGDSGADAKQFIADGQVTVDGETETRMRCKITVGKVVELDGEQVKVAE
ncbi:RNA-binding S4 domain-containing protein, partial [Morganella morganii]|uniref:RNA-binding S4 domain-containing protein n=1 Tax=Morganella morganii TaxID=582 RepID=UPI0015F3F6F2